MILTLSDSHHQPLFQISNVKYRTFIWWCESYKHTINVVLPLPDYPYKHTTNVVFPTPDTPHKYMIIQFALISFY